MSGSRISGFDWENGLILSPVPGMSPLLADFLESEGLSCVPRSGWPTRLFWPGDWVVGGVFGLGLRVWGDCLCFGAW